MKMALSDRQHMPSQNSVAAKTLIDTLIPILESHPAADSHLKKINAHLMAVAIQDQP
jgi:hypothetical protein